jgi:hypothetical protein
MCSHPQEANIRLPKSLFGQALVDWSDVQTVLLEESWDQVDPIWKTLQKDMTILTEQVMSPNRP